MELLLLSFYKSWVGLYIVMGNVSLNNHDIHVQGAVIMMYVLDVGIKY